MVVDANNTINNNCLVLFPYETLKTFQQILRDDCEVIAGDIFVSSSSSSTENTTDISGARNVNDVQNKNDKQWDLVVIDFT